MRNRNTNIVLRGTAIFLLIVATILTISALVAYSRQRNNYPAGMTIGGVPVGGLDPQAASQRILEVYNTPVQLQYGGGTIQVEPSVLGFQMDMDSMLAAADLARTGGPFWNGFWDYLWNRDPDANAVPLRATIAEDRLRSYLQTEVAPRYDAPSSPAQPVPGTTRFTPGEPGQTLDIDQAVPLIEDALRSPSSRSVTLLSAQNAAAGRPTWQNLEILMKQQVETSGFDGTIGVYLLDLQNGQEIHFALNGGQELPVNPTDVPFTASSTMKIPILVAYFIGHGPGPIDSSVDAKIISMIHKSDNAASDDVMKELDPMTGPLVVTQDMQKLGFQNTFMAGFFAPGSDLLQRFTTPANSRTDVNNALDPFNQTTPSDMGMLLGDVYQCADNGGGALVAAFPGKITQDSCKQIIKYLEADKIGIFLEAGVPEGTEVAHKHGWVNVVGSDGIVADWSDAGIVYTPGGNFVLTMYTHHPVQIVFDMANHLFANITQAVYNYYNTAP